MNILEPTRRRSTKTRCLLDWNKCLAVSIALTLLFSGDLLSEESPSLEYQVKGAFLMKFGKFVEWPKSKEGSDERSPFLIGILGSDPFGKSFDEAAKKEKMNGRQVAIKRALTVDELSECQIVFVSPSVMEQMSGALSQLSTNSVLTVGDSPGFARNGGMIGFIKEDGKVRFEINPTIAEKSGLKISSKLLQVGKVVTGGKTNPG